MKKIKTHKLLYGASVLMVLGFGIHVAVDYYRYHRTLNSAPFGLGVAVNAVIFLLPALLAFLAGYIVNKKISKKEKTQ